MDDVELQKELQWEAQYQELLDKYKVEFNMITPEELEKIQAERKRKNK